MPKEIECPDFDCDYFDPNFEENCCYSDDNTKCVLIDDPKPKLYTQAELDQKVKDENKKLKLVLEETYKMYSGRLNDLNLKLKSGECDLVYKIFDLIKDGK